MTNLTKTTDAINLLLQLGKIGTRVQILLENGELVPDQLFFKSLQDRKISWSENRRSIQMSPYVLILPGKITGLLSIVPCVEHIPDSLCLGIVSKNTVLEVIFQNSRDRSIWSKGLELLVSSPCLQIVPSPTSKSSSKYYLNKYKDLDRNDWNGNDIIQWHEITKIEKQNIIRFYKFLSISSRGSIFFEYKKLKVPKKILLKLDMNGDKLYGLDEQNNNVFTMFFDAETVIIDPKSEQKQDGESSDDNKVQRIRFSHAQSSMHCFSIIGKEQSLHIGCQDMEQYLDWRKGLEYLCDKRNYSMRVKVRRAVLAGDLLLSPGKKNLLHKKEIFM